MSEAERGTGQTTEQLRSAPHGAYFVWCNNYLHYPRDLCQHIGRTDIVVISGTRYRAKKCDIPPGAVLVIDHAYREHV